MRGCGTGSCTGTATQTHAHTGAECTGTESKIAPLCNVYVILFIARTITKVSWFFYKKNKKNLLKLTYLWSKNNDLRWLNVYVR